MKYYIFCLSFLFLLSGCAHNNPPSDAVATELPSTGAEKSIPSTTDTNELTITFRGEQLGGMFVLGNYIPENSLDGTSGGIEYVINHTGNLICLDAKGDPIRKDKVGCIELITSEKQKPDPILGDTINLEYSKENGENYIVSVETFSGLVQEKYIVSVETFSGSAQKYFKYNCSACAPGPSFNWINELKVSQ